MIRYCIPALFVLQLFAHNPNLNPPNWKQYYRLGVVNVGGENIGLATYGRLRRTTDYTFNDLRFYGHFYKNDQEVRFRKKTSRRFLSFKKFYSFNTLLYEKNTFIDVNLRYHLNQGMGWLIQQREDGNMTWELGIAFDNSDYLNNTRKTYYARTGFTSDYTLKNLETKFELDYFYQLSEEEKGIDLSRFQLVGELQYTLKKGLSLLYGFTQDFPLEDSFDLNKASIFATLAINHNLTWSF
tara:strand:+ start:1063 stop:1782 length:720 start_codon:yes stop_codon:yes gene_type:complete